MSNASARTILPKSICVLILVLFFVGCHKRHTKNHVSLSTKKRELARTYTLAIDGIECKQCMYTIVRALRDSNLISYAECACPKNDYAQARVMCSVEKINKFSVPAIKKIIEREQFVLREVTGNFDGLIIQKQDRLVFVSPEIGPEVALVYDAHYFELGNTPLTPTEKQVSLFGTLVVDKNQIIIKK